MTIDPVGALNAEVKRIENEIETMEGQELVEAIKVYGDIRNLHEKLTSMQKELGKLYRKATQEVLPELFEEEGVSSITVNGHRYTATSKLRASIPAANKPKAFDWLREHGLGDLITEGVNSNTLSSSAGQLMSEEGIALDPEIFSVYYQNNVSRTKA